MLHGVFLAAAVAVAHMVGAGAGNPQLARGAIQTAQYVSGVVTQVDRDARTITVDSVTYFVRYGAGSSLSVLQPGEQIEVTFIESAGRREVLYFRELDRDHRDRPFLRIFP